MSAPSVRDVDAHLTAPLEIEPDAFAGKVVLATGGSQAVGLGSDPAWRRAHSRA